MVPVDVPPPACAVEDAAVDTWAADEDMDVGVADAAVLLSNSIEVMMTTLGEAEPVCEEGASSSDVNKIVIGDIELGFCMLVASLEVTTEAVGEGEARFGEEGEAAFVSLTC